MKVSGVIARREKLKCCWDGREETARDIYFVVGGATPLGEPNWDNICISICEVRFHALRGMTGGSFDCNTGKRQGETETMKALETDERVELSPASSCVQKKFPSENGEAIPGDQPLRYFFQSRGSLRGKPSRPRYSPSSSAFRFYILSFSLFPHRLYVARRCRRKKSTSLAQIFFFMYTWHIKISTPRIIRAVC